MHPPSSVDTAKGSLELISRAFCGCLSNHINFLRMSDRRQPSARRPSAATPLSKKRSPSKHAMPRPKGENERRWLIQLQPRENEPLINQAELGRPREEEEEEIHMCGVCVTDHTQCFGRNPPTYVPRIGQLRERDGRHGRAFSQYMLVRSFFRESPFLHGLGGFSTERLSEPEAIFSGRGGALCARRDCYNNGVEVPHTHVRLCGGEEIPHLR